MKFLLDTSEGKARQKLKSYPDLIEGQLLTPLLFDKGEY